MLNINKPQSDVVMIGKYYEWVVSQTGVIECYWDTANYEVTARN